MRPPSCTPLPKNDGPALIAYILKRLVQLIPTAVGAVTLVFIVIRLAPGDPVIYLIGEMEEGVTVETVELLRRQYGLDQPIPIQFVNYVSNVMSGDFGYSIHSRQPVFETVLSQFRFTLMLAFGGMVVAIFLGIPLGIISALRRNTRLDYALMTWAVFGVSAPGFWIGILLIYFLSFRLDLFPMFGAGSESLSSLLWALVLPSIAVGTRSMSLLARISRSAMLEVLAQDYIRTARAKGLAHHVVAYRHALRNAAIPIITVLGFDLASLLGGTVTIEIVFSRPGLGRLMVNSIFARDYPLVQGAILLFAFSVILVNLLTDIAYSLIDPRITYD